MAKEIMVTTLKSYDGRTIKVPVIDSDGMVATNEGKVETRDATIVDVLDILIRAFPKDRMTMENITEGVRLKTQLLNATDSTLNLDDSTHSWATKMLKDNAVGPRLFGFDLISIIDAMDNFKRLHTGGSSERKAGKTSTKD